MGGAITYEAVINYYDGHYQGKSEVTDRIHKAFKNSESEKPTGKLRADDIAYAINELCYGYENTLSDIRITKENPVFPEQKELEELRSRIEEAESARKEAQGKFDKIQYNVEREVARQVEKGLAEMTTKVTNSETTITTLETEIQKLKKKHKDDLEKTVEKLKRTHRKETYDLQFKLPLLQKRKEELRQKNKELLQEVMELKSSQRLRGIKAREIMSRGNATKGTKAAKTSMRYTQSNVTTTTSTKVTKTTLHPYKSNPGRRLMERLDCN